MVSVHDCGLCGTLGFCGRSGSGLMWGDRRPVQIGIGFFWVGASGVWTTWGNQPAWSALLGRLQLTLTLTLGCWVFGSVGSGSASCLFYICLHTLRVIHGSHRGVIQRGLLRGLIGQERWFYYIAHLDAFADKVVVFVCCYIPCPNEGSVQYAILSQCCVGCERSEALLLCGSI